MKNNAYSPPVNRSPSKRPSRPERSRNDLIERLRLPGLVLLLLSLSHLIWEFALLFSPVSSANREVIGFLFQSDPLPVVLLRGIVCCGLWNLLRLRFMVVAYLSVIASCIPYLAAWYVLSIPFGCWAIVVLNDPLNGLWSRRKYE